MTDDKYQQADRYARSRMESIAEAVALYRDDIEDETVHDIGLDVEVLGNKHRDKYRIVVLLGTGGPHDELRYTVSDGDVDTVEYWYADWFYGTYVPLRTDEIDTARDFIAAVLDLSYLEAYLDR